MAATTSSDPVALTQAYKTAQNREAAKIAALVSLYYLNRVDVTNPQAVDAWLALMIPRIISASDFGARLAATYYDRVRGLEVPKASPFSSVPSVGVVDPGVRKSLMAVGPGDYMNKLKVIQTTEGLSPSQQRAAIAEAKQVTSKKLAAATLRHTQAGSRQTIFDNSAEDRVALGWVRVTKEKPCAFCAMLASRGLQYRSFKEGAFDSSNSRFTGDGDAKVHDNCGCCLKPVYTKDDHFVQQTKTFADMWTEWGAGGGPDAALRFRRGYDHWVDTGEKLSWDDVAKAA